MYLLRFIDIRIINMPIELVFISALPNTICSPAITTPFRKKLNNGQRLSSQVVKENNFAPEFIP